MEQTATIKNPMSEQSRRTLTPLVDVYLGEYMSLEQLRTNALSRLKKLYKENGLCEQRVNENLLQDSS